LSIRERDIAQLLMTFYRNYYSGVLSASKDAGLPEGILIENFPIHRISTDGRPYYDNAFVKRLLRDSSMISVLKNPSSYGEASTYKIVERAYRILREEEGGIQYPHTVYRFVSPDFIGRRPLITGIRKIYSAELTKNRVKVEEVKVETSRVEREKEKERERDILTPEQEEEKIQEFINELLETGSQGKSVGSSTKTAATKRLALLKSKTSSSKADTEGDDSRKRGSPGIVYLFKMLGRGPVSDQYGNLQGSPSYSTPEYFTWICECFRKTSSR
jgi:hypothetical protein